jgi:3'(2'), 5'-bisphosphate nucleotidase
MVHLRTPRGLDLERELVAAERLAREAGAAVMRTYGAARSEVVDHRSPVTEADRASNRVIVAGIAAAFPGDPILSEESADAPERLDAERVWIVDPLDGTKEFLARNGEFAVMIGLAVGGRACLGIVFCPAVDALFSAAEGRGAYVERGGSRRRLVRAPWTGDRIRMVGSRSHPDPRLAAIQRALAGSEMAPCGSAGVKCARIAEGERDLYVHPVPYLREWDTCAPEAVLREAGGSVTDCLGEPLVYNKPSPAQPHGILACAPGLFPRVLPTVRGAYIGSA